MATKKKANTNPTRKVKVSATKDVKGKVSVSLPGTEQHEATTKFMNVAGIHSHQAYELLESLNVADEHLRYKQSEVAPNVPLANKADVDNEKSRAQGAETTLQTNITNEATARQSGDSSLSSSISAEATARANADDALQDNIDEVNEVIPSQASSTNQLADKAFVNSSIATSTANYIFDPDTDAEWESVADLKAYTTKQTVKNGDYAIVKFLVTEDKDKSKNEQRYDYFRYKFTPPIEQGIPYANGWGREYQVGQGFTAVQWAAITSGITAALVLQIHSHSNKSLLDTIDGSEELIFETDTADITINVATISE